MQALSTVFWGVLVLSILVFIHEGGHYLAASSFGVRVSEFFLGMPSRFRIATRLKKRGTMVGVTPVLLGGYVRICGMEGCEDERLSKCLGLVLQKGRAKAHELALELGCEDEECYEMLAALVDCGSIEPVYDPELGEYEGQSDWPESFRTVARDAAGLTILDRDHDPELRSDSALHMPGEPYDPGVSTEEFLAGEQAKTYEGCNFFQRIVILAMGPLFNLLTALIIIVGIYSIMGVDVVSNSRVIGEVYQDSLAAEVGLKAGDEVIRIGEYEISSWEDYTEPIQHYLGKHEDFDIVYLRDGAEHTARVDLEEGKDYELLGVYGTLEHIRLSVPDAVKVSFAYAYDVAAHVVQLLNPSHTKEILDQSSSVVGIAQMTNEAAQSGLEPLLLVAASISMSLCFMNLLPIPPLDGGKILIEIIQLIIGRPLSKRAQTAVSYLGLAFFLAIFVYVLRLDILRLFG